MISAAVRRAADATARILSRKQGVTHVAVFLLVVGYWLPVAPIGLNIYDEGLRLYGADRILAGERPYRDFFAYYGPGEYYWPAYLFSLFGPQIIVFRLGALAAGALAAVGLFALGRNAIAMPWAFLPVAGLLLSVTTGEEFVVCGPALALALVGGAVLTATERPGRARLFIAGVLFGSVTLFRLDFGAYGVLAAALTILMLPSATTTGPNGWTARHTAARLAYLLIGVATIVVPVYGVFALDGPYRLVHDLLVFPATAMPYRRLPYLDEPRRLYGAMRAVLPAGPWGTLVFSVVRALVFVVPLLFAVTLVGLASSSLRARVLARRTRTGTLGFVLLFSLGLANYARVRFDFHHALPLSVVSACGVAIIVGSVLDRPRAGHGISVVRPAVAFLAGLALAGMFVINVRAAAHYVPLDVPRAAGIRVRTSSAWIARAVADIDAIAGERILVACGRHDRVHWNAAILYFLSGRASGTYFHDFIPGLTVTQEIQERIVRDLRRHDVRTALVWQCPLPDEPNPSRLSTGVSILDDFLRAEFTVVRREPDYEVLVKSDGARVIR